MDINDYRTKYTREEFIEEIQKGNNGKIQTTQNCPKQWNLVTVPCIEYDDCKNCWSDAVKDIQFKGEKDEIIEELNTEYKLGDKIIKKDNTNFSNGEKTAIITKIEKSQCNEYNLICLDTGRWVIEDDIKLYNNQWIFNLKEYKNKRISINCESKEEAEKLFNILITNGIPKSEINTMEYSYNSETCYDFEDGKMYYGSIGYYNTKNYKIYKFSNIDFSQVWNKESIDEVALNNINEEEFDITKAKYITKEQLNKRGYITGDILFDGSSMAIVYGNKVLHMNDNCVETLDIRAFDKIIPIELIENNLDIQKTLSRKISGITNYFNDMEDYFIKIKEKDTITTKVYQVKFTYDSDNFKDFISDDSDIKIGDMVECQCSINSSNYQYCRVKNIIEEEELTENEIKLYRKCRKLSN